jgi:hypothetical protein
MDHSIGYNCVYKNKRLMKTDIAIDSRDRNKEINSYRKDYSDPNDYQITINKYKKFRNVISVRLIESMIPNTQFIINENNRWLDIILPDGTTEINISLKVGNYSFSRLAKELETELNKVGTKFTVNLNNTDTFKTTIVNELGNFTLLFDTGINANCSVAPVLGFEKKDVTSEEDTDSISTYYNKYKLVSDYPYHINSTKYVDLKIDEIPDLGTTIDIKEDVQSQILKRIPMNVDFGKEGYYKATDANRAYNYFNPIELSKLNIKLFSDNGKIYDSNRIENYIILELIMLQDEAPDNLGFHPKQNNAIKDIKSKVDTLVLDDKDVMISNKMDNEFIDIQENLDTNESFKGDILIDDNTKVTDSMVNTNEVKNEVKNQTNIIDLQKNVSEDEPEGISNKSILLNNVSEFKDAHYDKINLNKKTDFENIKKISTKNNTKNLESDLHKDLFKDKDRIAKIFEDYKLIILSVALFIFIVMIVKGFSKNK